MKKKMRDVLMLKMCCSSSGMMRGGRKKAEKNPALPTPLLSSFAPFSCALLRLCAPSSPAFLPQASLPRLYLRL
jgi:hypothetical protein